jgi:hypothetical protein
MLLSSLASLEQNDSLHLARLMLILRSLAADSPETPLAGLTKLAKLDFLLRYPVFLERALQARHANTTNVKTEDHERFSVESTMVRYRFGPWDERYRRFLNLLSAMGLIQVNVEGRTITIFLTTAGVTIANDLTSRPEFEQLSRRAQLLKHFDLTATNLMRFIYDTFPEIASLRSGETIR